jgi:hypothetical protein
MIQDLVPLYGRIDRAARHGERRPARPRMVDDFSRVSVPIDARELHLYAADWTPDGVEFSVDGQAVKTVRQSPDYPMQLMLGIYEFPPAGGEGRPGPYPKAFVVDHVRGYRLTG